MSKNSKKKLPKLKKYQKKIVKRVLKQPDVALHVGMGLGKTRSVLHALSKMKNRPPVLIVGPIHVVESTWPDEIRKWKLDLTYSLMRGKPAQREAALYADADLYAINFEMIEWLADRRFNKEFRKFKILVIDELTKTKSTKSAPFRLLKGRRSWFDRHIGMTGIITPESYTDLYGQMSVLTDIWGTKKKFLDDHFVDKSKNPVYTKWEIRNKKAAKRIEKAVAPYILTLSSEDHLEVPPFVHQDVWLDLPPKLRKHYDTLEQDMYVEEEASGWEVNTDSVSATRIKLRQVLSGFVYSEEGETLVFDDSKFKAASNILLDIDESVLVMYQLKEERRQLAEKLQAQLLKGKQGKKIIKQWNKGKIHRMAGHPRSMGHGLNLQDGGHHIFWYSLPWSMEEYHQSNARLRRTGQTEPTVIHRLLFRNTIDEAIVDAQDRKHSTHAGFVKALKAYRR